jgi:Protein of unknown function (DUF2934)
MEVHMQDLEQVIRERAYHLWIADGCNDGNADAHWLAAQREVLASSLGNIGRVQTSSAASAVRKKKATAKRKNKAA